MDFLREHWLDITSTILGLTYIILEYRASIWLWFVGFMMQSLGIVLYYQKGLYADCGMEFYYLAMTIYGFIMWKFFNGRKAKEGTTSTIDTSSSQTETTSTVAAQSSSFKCYHFEKRFILPWTIATLVIWGTIWWILVTYTDSRVPITDSFTTALSFVGIWALARKYLEQWLIWIVVDVITCVLYFYKDIPFKASLYALYVVIAIAGYFRWKKQLESN